MSHKTPEEEELDVELEYDESSSDSSEEIRGVFPGEEDDDSAATDLTELRVDGEVAFGLYEPLARDEAVGGHDRREVGEEARPDRLQSLVDSWCNCGHCKQMDNFDNGDLVCCREIPEVCQEADRFGSACITTTHPFEPAVLNPVSLYIGWLEYTERWRQAAKNFQARTNEKYRYVAYRKLVRWCWGWLGKDIRVQLPACAHARIIEEYPDMRNHYKGTILRPLDIDA